MDAQKLSNYFASHAYCLKETLHLYGSQQDFLISRSFGRHKSSETHIHSDIALKTFGKSRIDVAVSEQRKQEISLHNARVSENRYILKCLIDTVILLAKQELAFRGHDESEGSLNRGNYTLN